MSQYESINRSRMASFEDLGGVEGEGWDSKIRYLKAEFMRRGGLSSGNPTVDSCGEKVEVRRFDNPAKSWGERGREAIRKWVECGRFFTSCRIVKLGN